LRLAARNVQRLAARDVQRLAARNVLTRPDEIRSVLRRRTLTSRRPNRSNASNLSYFRTFVNSYFQPCFQAPSSLNICTFFSTLLLAYVSRPPMCTKISRSLRTCFQGISRATTSVFGKQENNQAQVRLFYDHTYMVTDSSFELRSPSFQSTIIPIPRTP